MSRYVKSFKVDPFPGAPKILFVAYAHSPHTINWINLLKNKPYNIRVFGMPLPIPPPRDWPIPTYITYPGTIYDEANRIDPRNRIRLHPNPSKYLVRRIFDKAKNKIIQRIQGVPTPEKWLSQIIREWQPDMVHTLSYEPSVLYLNARRIDSQQQRHERWIFSVWGMGDIEFQKANPTSRVLLEDIIATCDFVTTDNAPSLPILRHLGATEQHLSTSIVVPGNGGIEVDKLISRWQKKKSSERRLILWPKAYDSPYTSPLAVLEALKSAWEYIQPCEIRILSVVEKSSVSKWYWTLDDEMRKAIKLQVSIPHDEVLDLMLNARVMLAPSLLDGTPNTLLEAMACGAFPIVSPLESIRALVKEENVLFAHSLYPQEIANAIIRAMNDDDLVDRATQQNINIVRQFANRPQVREKVIGMYNDILSRSKNSHLIKVD
jgi:glycosyltransferase involved in cell wall biosynthesis